jgi:hypothetical protein
LSIRGFFVREGGFIEPRKQALRLLANPPLQLLDNGARSQFNPTYIGLVEF